MIELGGLEQRLGRNAARIQAGATEGGRAIVVLPLIYTGDAELVLRGADGRRVTGRPCADDDDVEGIGRALRTLVVGGHGSPLGRDGGPFIQALPLPGRP